MQLWAFEQIKEQKKNSRPWWWKSVDRINLIILCTFYLCLWFFFHFFGIIVQCCCCCCWCVSIWNNSSWIKSLNTIQPNWILQRFFFLIHFLSPFWLSPWLWKYKCFSSFSLIHFYVIHVWTTIFVHFFLLLLL